MSAHITVLVPFMAPEQFSAGTERALDRALRERPAFTFKLARVGRFAETAYLEPDPSEPFVELTRTIVELFPDYPPYAGAHSEVIPHLTVADGSSSNARSVEAALQRALDRSGPIACFCREVHLVENVSGKWRVRCVFKLAGSGA